MADILKARKKKTEEKEKPVKNKPEETKTESVVVSDVITETTERIEVIEEVPLKAKSEAETPDESVPAADPLTEFKEKMTEEEESPISNMPLKKNFMWPILFVFIIALGLMAGIFIYKQSANKDGKVNVVSLSPTPTLAPKPTKAEIDLTKHTIKILNGSETEGEAGRQRSNLEEKGFTVSSIGNAQNSDYTKTIIQAKEDVDKDFLDKLKSVLEKSFVVGEIEELSEDADSDLIIIIGSKNN